MHAVCNMLVLGSGLFVDWVFVQDSVLLLSKRLGFSCQTSQVLVTAEACTASSREAVDKHLYAKILSVWSNLKCL